MILNEKFLIWNCTASKTIKDNLNKMVNGLNIWNEQAILKEIEDALIFKGKLHTTSFFWKREDKLILWAKWKMILN